VSLLSDLAVNRSAGRFKYKDGVLGWNKVGGDVWEVVYDAHPEDGNQIKIHESRTAWRPHKGGPPFARANCVTCKTGQYILEWPYMGTPHEKAKLDRSSEPYDMLKAVNYSVTCNLCHDPHSAEPRVIYDSMIRSMTEPEFKDNLYQSDPNRTKIEVINMGERGFPRKIAILGKYDSKLQCGQCHCNTDNGGEFSVENDKLLSARAVDNMNITPLMGPLEYLSFYEKRGWYNSGKHPDTDARLIQGGHPNVEIVYHSKHDKAGVGCTDCHYAKETDAKTKKTYRSHQASLPLFKIQQTCITAGCHGKGSKQNWKEEDALYSIKTIQHLQRKRLAELEFNVNRIIAGIVSAQRTGGLDKAVMEKAQRAHTRANAILTYWATDYSDGFHNPELSEKSLTRAIVEAEASYLDLNKALKEKGAAK
jgi:formate-dependent nitrite reductase cytochrome c552 subunit